MKNVMLMSAVAALTSTAAFAGGIAEPVMEPAPAPVMAAPAPVVLTNDWSGFYIGGQVGAGSVESDPAGIDTDLTNYGVQGGYLYDLGSFVLGGEASINKLDIDDVDGDNYVSRVGAIAGYDAGRFMPYITGGFAQLSLDDQAGDSVEDNGSYYGIGATYAVTNSVNVGVEYLEHQFDDFDDSGLDLDANTTSLKVNYSF